MTDNQTETTNRTAEANEQKLSVALQESILATLVFDDRWGSVIAAQVKAEHFDQPLNEIAAKVLEYRASYRRPPGAVHLDDMFGKELAPGTRPGRIHQFLFDIAGMRPQLNAEYVASRVTSWVNRQLLKAALIQAGQEYEAGVPTEAIQESYEKILRKMRQAVAQPTLLQLPATRAELSALFAPREADEFWSGIKVLDKRRVVPERQTLTCLLGLQGAGKSWWLINYGRRAAQLGARVLHVTLELSAEKTRRRYVQNILALPQDPKRDNRPCKITLLKIDEVSGRLTGLAREERPPRNAAITEGMAEKLAPVRARLRLQHYPGQTLTIKQLRANLDRWRQTEDFVPDVLILDYIAKLRTSSDNYRIDLMRAADELRAIAVEYNLAAITAQQINREGAMTSKLLTRAFIAEDFSMINTADQVLVLNRTDDEKTLGLARVWVDKVRDLGGEDGWGCVMSQNYAWGQFCLDSAPLQKEEYQEMLLRLAATDAGRM